ncbi:MAG TPA: hypothetical protein VJ853_08525 [Thermoanaerobaculia bacterium]|nr:hypothetical protein [Thermoanaerobaculia bacterium]
MILFVVANFFRRRKWKRADDEMPSTPLVQMLLFWVSFGTAVLLGSLATTTAMNDSYVAATFAGCGAAACLAASVVLWRDLNR